MATIFEATKQISERSFNITRSYNTKGYFKSSMNLNIIDGPVKDITLLSFPFLFAM